MFPRGALQSDFIFWVCVTPTELFVCPAVVFHRVVVVGVVSFIFPFVEKFAQLLTAGCGWTKGSTFGSLTEMTCVLVYWY